MGDRVENEKERRVSEENEILKTARRRKLNCL